MLDVCLLGTGGMMPLPNRYLTSFLLRYGGKMLLIDCGEGTQVTLKSLGFGFKNIDAICFTHFHADHISGLPGLLLTIGASSRTEPLTLIGPPGLEQVVRSLCVIATEIPFALLFLELPVNGKTNTPVPNTEFWVSALPLDHGTTCFGYTVEIKRIGKFDVEKAKALPLPRNFWGNLQKGEIVEWENNTYTPDMVMGLPRKGFKIAYCTDTRPTKDIPSFVQGADLFVCEGLYGDPEKAQKAMAHKHMTFQEAAELARLGNVSKLWLTHFSPALVAPKEHLHLARQIFANTFVGYDRLTHTFLFEDKELK